MPSLPPLHELLPVLGFTFAQAFASAIVAVAFGFVGALGLQTIGVRFGGRSLRFVEAFALLPNVTPVLVLILAVFRFFHRPEPIVAIVGTHALLNVGLVSVALSRAFQSKLAGVADLAWIEGAGRLRFLRRVALPLLRGELLALFLFVFALCFASYSVPAVFGGSYATTIEMMILWKVRISGEWGEAIGLSILQMGVLMSLAFVLGREPPTTLNLSRRGQRLMSWAGGIPFVVLPSLLIIVALLDQPWRGLAELGDDVWNIVVNALILGTSNSMLVATLSGLLVIALLMGIAYCDPRGVSRRILLGLVAPSAIVVGFAILYVWRQTGTATLIKMAIGLALVGVPSFYRLRWDSVLSSIRGQRAIAETLGASRALVFRRIVFPQTIGPACFIAGLMSMWAWGDFALSRVVAEGDSTLALFTQALMQSYRLELALTLTWVLLLGSAVTFFLFEGAGRVLGSKSQT